MTRFSQFRYTNLPPGGGRFPGGFLGRLVGLIVGLGVFGIAVFLGAIFLAALVGIVLIGSLVVTVRLWWVKRQMQAYAREHGDLDAEYVEIRETSVRTGEARGSGAIIEGEVVDKAGGETDDKDAA